MFNENPNVFLKDFGEPVRALRAGVEVAAFTVIFDNPDLAGAVGSIQVNARERLLLCTEKDAKPLNLDDEIIVRCERFVLLEKHPDGTGMTTLVVAPGAREG